MSDLIVRGKFDTPVGRAIVAAEWRSKGYSCDLFVDPPGQEWNGFVHSTNEYVTVVEGRLRMIVGEETVTLEEGDEVFIPRNAVHSVHNIHTGVSRWLYGYG